MTVDVRPAGLPAAGPGLRIAFHPASATIVAHVLHVRRVHSLEREAFVEALGGVDLGPGAILVHTCHRVELYLAAGSADLPALPPLPAGAERLEDVDAVRHLIEVACGLDSAVFGEDQILHQLRATLAGRRDGGRIDSVLDRLFQVALRAGRRSHAWFDGSPRSLADVALDVIARASGEIRGRTVLVVGAGKMGRLSAFAAHRRGARVLVVNRTDERAGAWQVGPGDAGRLVAAGVPVVDLSSPPSVPEALQERLGDRFASVDDLVVGSESAPQERLRRRIERLVADSGRDYCAWLRARESVPLIQAVASSAEQIRQAELQWLLHRLPELDPDERAVVEQMSHRLVAALLHAPLDALHSDEGGTLERAARDLFGL